MNTELQAMIYAWHKLIAESATTEQRDAARRNAEELRSEPPTPAQPEPEPDAMTRIAAALERIADRLDGFSDNDNLAGDALRVNVLR